MLAQIVVFDGVDPMEVVGPDDVLSAGRRPASRAGGAGR
jgi:hypothetical protein